MLSILEFYMFSFLDARGEVFIKFRFDRDQDGFEREQFLMVQLMIG